MRRLGTILVALASIGFPIGAEGESPGSRVRSTTVGQLPVSFELNVGQTDPAVRVLARTSGTTVFFTKRDAVFVFGAPVPREQGTHDPIARLSQARAPARNSAVVRMQLEGSIPTDPVPLERLPGIVNSFIGDDPARWRANIPTFAGVLYPGVYPGIDLLFNSDEGKLEYQFLVAAGADPRRVEIRFAGVDRIAVRPDGSLRLATAIGDVPWSRPVLYQPSNAGRTRVGGDYRLAGRDRVRFAVGEYDAARPLVIDPSLVYSTFLGGGLDDGANGIAVDSSGAAYVTGSTWTGFPTVNPIQATNHGGTDAFVAKINRAGSALVYATYLGGQNFEHADGIAVDSSGAAYVTGSTASSDFPTSKPLQPRNRGSYDGFVAKLNPSGSALAYSTYLGGTHSDGASRIAVDSAGGAYVAGLTGSYDFPTAKPIRPSNRGGTDAFVAKINPAGSALAYSTYLGGTDYELAFGIAVDFSGAVYVTGLTRSRDFPTANALQPANRGATDAFVVKINPAGSALAYSTYLGGAANDDARGVAVDSSGAAYVAGFTSSSNFPMAKPFQAQYRGYYDAFVIKINAAGAALVYSTYLGGGDYDGAHGIAVDPSGTAYVAGVTRSSNFPTAGPIQAGYRGSGDAFVTQMTPSGSALLHSTYLGGGDFDEAHGVTVDSSRAAYVAGSTASANFPTKNPLQTGRNGYSDAFVTKIGDVPYPPTKVTATAGNHTASVTWKPGASGGSPITSFTVRSTPDGRTVTVGPTTTQATISGLRNGVTYTFRVVATNAIGPSDPSAPSNPVTPATIEGHPEIDQILNLILDLLPVPVPTPT